MNSEGCDFFEHVKITSDSELITQALFRIEKGYPHFLEKTGAISKSNVKSSATREKANDLFKKKKWLPALKNYSQCIAFAENRSTELKFGYANRSSLLLHRGFYQECIEDIDQALKLDYPADKKPQLFTRRQKASQLILTQKKRIIYEAPPPLPSKNKRLQGATEAIQMAQDRHYGHFIQATRDIAPGEILLIEDPYALVVAEDYRTTHCGDCSKLCFNPIPCLHCSNEMYCSEDCRDKAYFEYHQYECIILNFCAQEMEDQIGQLALRITLKGFRNYQSSVTNSTEDLYEEIVKLQTHRNDLTKSNLMILAFNLAKQFHILKNHTNFLSLFHFEDKEDILKDHLLRNRLICCFRLATLQYKLDTSDQIGDQLLASPSIGLYTSYSYFNHACFENVNYGFYGRTLVMRAVRKIKKGEQCFINYGCIFYKRPKIDRQMNLIRNFLFTCKCIACTEDWPTFDVTAMSKKNFCLNSSAYKLLVEAKAMAEKENILDEETRQNLFKKCAEIESIIQSEGPTVNLILLYNLTYLLVVLRYHGLDF